MPIQSRYRLLVSLLIATLTLSVGTASVVVASASATSSSPSAHVAKKAKHKKIHGRHGKLKTKIKHSTPAGPAAGGKGAGTGDDYPAKWKNAPQDSQLDD